MIEEDPTAREKKSQMQGELTQVKKLSFQEDETRRGERREGKKRRRERESQRLTYWREKKQIGLSPRRQES